MSTNKLQHIELVATDSIITGDYQRDLSERTVSNIVESFDPAMLGVLVVNKRNSGEYAVLDGQHRLAALRILGVKETNCVVIEGLTPEEEADYFRFQNTNKRPLTAYDLYHAGLCAADPHFVTLDALLTKYGFRVSQKGGIGCIAAVDTLSQITRMYGFPVLELVIAYIKNTWPTDMTIVRRDMLAGMAEFVSRYGDKVSIDRFTSRMADKHPSKLLYEAQERTHGRLTGKSAFNRQIRFVTCGVLVDEYNRGLGSKSRYRLEHNWNEANGKGASE